MQPELPGLSAFLETPDGKALSPAQVASLVAADRAIRAAFTAAGLSGRGASTDVDGWRFTLGVVQGRAAKSASIRTSKRLKRSPKAA